MQTFTESIIFIYTYLFRWIHLAYLPPLTWQILNYLYTASVENERREDEKKLGTTTRSYVYIRQQ
jgi:hypothetical protein